MTQEQFLPEVGEQCSMGVAYNESGACDQQAWCNNEDRYCYELCDDTDTRKNQEIPRKDKYWCDYGDEVWKRPCKCIVDTMLTP